MRRGLAWLSTLPLILAGSQVAHVLAYRWVYPSSHVRLEALLSSGHGYMDHLPVVIAIAGAVVFVCLVKESLDAIRGRPVRALPAWAFAVLPVATFILQEVLERSLHAGTFFWQAVESPTFIPGLVLQLPFAIAAYMVARILLRSVDAVARIIRTRRRKVGLKRPRAVFRLPTAVALPRLAPLASASAGRAPPLHAR